MKDRNLEVYYFTFYRPSGMKPPIGMTTAMEAIGAGPSATPDDAK